MREQKSIVFMKKIKITMMNILKIKVLFRNKKKGIVLKDGELNKKKLFRVKYKLLYIIK